MLIFLHLGLEIFKLEEIKMTTLQVILTVAVGVLSIASIVFMLMFIIEMKSEETYEQPEVRSIFSSETYAETNSSEVNSMLANLDKEAEEVVEAPAAPAQINQVINIVVGDVSKEEKEKPEEIVVEEVVVEEAQEEVKEEPALIEEFKEETVEEVKEEEVQETVEEAQEEVKEEVVEEAKEEAQEEVVEETAEETKEESSEETTEISAETLLDYKTRLDKIVKNRDKIEKDLLKLQKAILNYERTKRRKARNQKMLDRRASELTNLNLIMYSVTDIKNVDEDKKVKQEELTAHIAELKASIQDADEFLDSNKEKNDHNIKMAKFLMQEKGRYAEEIAELEKLIAKTENPAA